MPKRKDRTYKTKRVRETGPSFLSNQPKRVQSAEKGGDLRNRKKKKKRRVGGEVYVRLTEKG